MGMMAAFAGLIDSFRLLKWWPTMGEGYMLTTMASVFVGGTSMFGGEATVFGTFIGAFLIGSLEAGIVAAGLSGVLDPVCLRSFDSCCRNNPHCHQKKKCVICQRL